MSAIERLLTKPCELVARQAIDPTDPDAELEDVVVGESTCELQQTTAGEVVDGRVMVTGWRVFLPAGVDLSGWDALRIDDVLLELDGDPWQVRHPRTGDVHHVEAALRRSH